MEDWNEPVCWTYKETTQRCAVDINTSLSKWIRVKIPNDHAIQTFFKIQEKENRVAYSSNYCRPKIKEKKRRTGSNNERLRQSRTRKSSERELKQIMKTKQISDPWAGRQDRCCFWQTVAVYIADELHRNRLSRSSWSFWPLTFRRHPNPPVHRRRQH